MDRSEFINLIAALTLSCGALVGLSSCASYRYVDANREGSQLKVSKEFFQEDSYVLVHNPAYSKPIFLIKGSFAEPPNLVVSVIICRFRRTSCSFNQKVRYYVRHTSST